MGLMKCKKINTKIIIKKKMDPLFLFFDSSSEEKDESTAYKRRLLRSKSDPLSLSDTAFQTRFRLSKEAFNFVLSQVDFTHGMSTAVPPKLQLAATLSLLAGGSFQHIVGNDYLLGMFQSTICKYVKKCIKVLEEKLCPAFIKFQSENAYECRYAFMEKYKIPGVIGCIDGTHFGLQRPSTNEHIFFNRKGFHSLNTMLICDYYYKILAINSKYGGSAHDSFVWKHSEERNLLKELYDSNTIKNIWVLGDSGYPLEPWCITPYRNPVEGSSEARFNNVHSKARCIIERTIGILKARWKILMNDKRSRYGPQKIASFGNVCAALHNVCLFYKVPRYTNVSAAEPIQETVDVQNETNLTKIGSKIRDHIKLSLSQN